MANPHKGEVGVTVNGTEYTLRPSFDSLCELEPLIGASIEEALDWIKAGRLSGWRAVIWALLHECHGDEIKTLKDASEWIVKADDGGVDVIAAIYRCFQLNLDETIEKSAAATPNPPDAQVGISAGYSSAPAESA